ncbi:MAG TPA: YkgJ family cysteine cluster protein [Acidimicrobiia bacterium]|nr:YkgJ family cysteine cluster protein [Acidimicrobiia bacterium]
MPARAHADDALDAGGFGSWISGMLGALRAGHGAEVPCGSCTACCTSSQFVPIGPDETDTLAHIPAELLFPAPRAPRGHVVLGYDERGHCPMLVDGRCSIYEHRPQACRTYDCRVFPAAGVDPGDDKPRLGTHTRRWRFDEPTAAERVRHDAVQAAAHYLERHRPALPATVVPGTATQLAVTAVEIHDLFVGRDDSTGESTVVEPELDAVRAELTRRRTALGTTSRACGE